MLAQTIYYRTCVVYILYRYIKSVSMENDWDCRKRKKVEKEMDEGYRRNRRWLGGTREKMSRGYRVWWWGDGRNSAMPMGNWAELYVCNGGEESFVRQVYFLDSVPVHGLFDIFIVYSKNDLRYGMLEQVPPTPDPPFPVLVYNKYPIQNR